jgi:hypothetical protein
VGAEVIDPFTALAAVNSAVKLTKAAISTCQNLSSLAGPLSQFFSAKEEAIKVVQQGGFKGSAMAKAIELELAVKEMQDLEKSIADLFFSANEVDLFKKIKARASQISSDQVKAERREREAAKRRKEEIDEVVSIVLVVVLCCVLLGTLLYFVYEALQLCKGNCAFQK